MYYVEQIASAHMGYQSIFQFHVYFSSFLHLLASNKHVPVVIIILSDLSQTGNTDNFLLRKKENSIHIVKHHQSSDLVTSYLMPNEG
jgi:hypothetical protein